MGISIKRGNKIKIGSIFSINTKSKQNYTNLNRRVAKNLRWGKIWEKVLHFEE